MAKRKSAKKETPDKKEKPDFEKKKKSANAKPGSKTRICKTYKRKKKKKMK